MNGNSLLSRGSVRPAKSDQADRRGVKERKFSMIGLLLHDSQFNNTSDSSQYFIQRFSVRIDFSDVGFQQNQICSATNPLCILAAHAAAEVVMRQYLVNFINLLLFILTASSHQLSVPSASLGF